MLLNRLLISFILILVGFNVSSCLIFVGTINGKSFFVKTNFTAWDAAKSRCEQGGMHLAVINSEDERSLVTNASGTSGLEAERHWTGARDVLSPSQFVWDYNNGTLNNSVISPFTDWVGIQTCVYVFTKPLTSDGFGTDRCEFQLPSICEIIHGKSFVPTCILIRYHVDGAMPEIDFR